MSLCSASAAAPFSSAPDADRRGRLTGQHGEPLPGRCRGPRERGVKKLLHLRPRPEVGFLVPVRDGAHADVPDARRTPRCSSAARPATRTRHARSSRSPRPWPADRRQGGNDRAEVTPGASARHTRTRAGASHDPPHPGGAHCHRRAARSLGRSPVACQCGQFTTPWSNT